MTIGYSTHWPKSMGPEYAGKPNHFVEKIWAEVINSVKGIGISDYEQYTIAYKKQFNAELSEYKGMFIDSKKHTFREDPKDRWKVGMKIHPVINNRTKNRFQFSPELVVKGIQKIEIYPLNFFRVKVDGKSLTDDKIETLALNDGFDSVEQFFAWFNKDFTGKIIHWTNLKY